MKINEVEPTDSDMTPTPERQHRSKRDDYATKKTIFIGFLNVALVMNNR